MKYNEKEYRDWEEQTGNVVWPNVETWQYPEKPVRRGVPIWVFLAVLIVAILGVVFNIRTRLALNRAIENASAWSLKYQELAEERDKIIVEDTQLFQTLIEQIEVQEEVFRVLSRERAHYKGLVSEEDYFTADKEITELLEYILEFQDSH